MENHIQLSSECTLVFQSRISDVFFEVDFSTKQNIFDIEANDKFDIQISCKTNQEKIDWRMAEK